MKRILAWVLVGGVLACWGCDKEQVSTPDKRFRVAMLLPGSENDHGWNQMAAEGLGRIGRELNARTRLVSNVKTSEFAGQLDYFASEGYDLIICHGGEFQQAVESAARRFPRTQFIVGGCPAEIPGAAAVEFMAGDASALAGVVAAGVSQSRKVAFVGAVAVPTLQACYDGFKAGAVQADASVKVLPALWTDSWDSSARAKEKTESALNDGGADVVFQNVDAAAMGVFEAVREARKRGKAAFAFGCNNNQNAVAGDVVLGSVVLDVPRTYRELAEHARDGKLKKGLLRLGLRGGYVDLVLNDAQPAITPQIRQNVEAARKSLLESDAMR